jgi:hypothetical protein
MGLDTTNAIAVTVIELSMILMLRLSLLYHLFDGHYDAEPYLDWEMTIEQKFSTHQVSEEHRVRQATSELKDFAIIWWTALVLDGNIPCSWIELKVAMHHRFVASSYHRDLHKKLIAGR